MVPPSRSEAPNTHRLLSGSFLGLPYRILNINHKKELLRGLWAVRSLSVGRLAWQAGAGTDE